MQDDAALWQGDLWMEMSCEQGAEDGSLISTGRKARDLLNLLRRVQILTGEEMLRLRLATLGP